LEHVADEAAASADEKVPAPQLVHVLARLAPAFTEYLPAAQPVQEADEEPPPLSE
jgi:hypothetical protein